MAGAHVGRLTPVDARVASLGENALNQLGIEDLAEVLTYEIESCLRG